MPTLDLPRYDELEPDVADRFNRIDRRPVVMEVKSLGKIFDGANGPIETLRDINFKVRRREFVCIIGPSGCGKSTLVRMLAGLDHPTSGLVTIDDKPVTGPGPDRGMVFQGYTLFPWLTVKKNVMFGLRLKLKQTGTTTVEAEARQWIEMVGLTRFIDAYPHQLSGGMKQRVAIARALANQPKVLLMDEPFGALDAQTRSSMQSYLKQIWMNVDVTVVFITHDLDEAILLADRIIVLAAHPGRILEIINVPLLQPRSAEALLAPRFLATRKRLDELIHPPKSTTEDEPDKLPVMRMTLVGDDVL